MKKQTGVLLPLFSIPSKYGIDMTNKLVDGLSENYVIVSGLAKGIDAVRQKAARKRQKKTRGGRGGGGNKVDPEENKKLYDDIIKDNGLVISEYPPSAMSKKENFLQRNRLIAGIGNCLILTESKGRSGSTSTVSYALEQGKDVGCVPYKADEGSNCNKFIKDGAYMIETSEDIMMIGKNY